MAPTASAAGTMLGRYQILKPLAKGGMAEVLLARAIGIKGFERHVVIKRTRVEHGTEQKSIELFLDEARLVAGLHHRNIVQVHDVGEEAGKYFFVMEYVHGLDTRALLKHAKDKKETVPLDHVITIVTAAAAGLHYAHEQRGPDRTPLGIVHRDISPGNILLAYDGGVKVVDFGIAKTQVRPSDTQAGEMKGKVGYMSPEQCKMQLIDRRTDIFQLGIVLYELLTVRRLFNKESRYETMSAIVDGIVAPPSKLRPGLPEDLEAIVLKTLATSPDDRYQTADELRLVLEAFANRAGLQVSPSRFSDYLKEQFGEVPEPWRDVDVPPPDPARISSPVLIGPPTSDLRPQVAEAPAKVAEAPAAKVAEPPADAPAPEPPKPAPPRTAPAVDRPIMWPTAPSHTGRNLAIVTGILLLAGALAVGAWFLLQELRSFDDDPKALAGPVAPPPEPPASPAITVDAAVPVAAPIDAGVEAAPADAAVEAPVIAGDAGVPAAIDKPQKPKRPLRRPARAKATKPAAEKPVEPPEPAPEPPPPTDEATPLE